MLSSARIANDRLATATSFPGLNKSIAVHGL